MALSDEMNGWSTWGKHVLKELESNETDHKAIMDELNKIRVEIATLKVKSGVWGAVAGLIPAALFLLFLLLRGHFV